MAWLQLSGSSEPFKARFPVAVNASALGSTGNKDVSIAVPKTLELFWTSLGSDGYDLRVTDADGFTLIDHKLSSFNYANRTCTIEVFGQSGTNTWSAQQSSIPMLWVYVGDADAAAAFSQLTNAVCVNARLSSDLLRAELALLQKPLRIVISGPEGFNGACKSMLKQIDDELGAEAITVLSA